jgi:hypothetical protein
MAMDDSDGQVLAMDDSDGQVVLQAQRLGTD